MHRPPNRMLWLPVCNTSSDHTPQASYRLPWMEASCARRAVLNAQSSWLVGSSRLTAPIHLGSAACVGAHLNINHAHAQPVAPESHSAAPSPTVNSRWRASCVRDTIANNSALGSLRKRDLAHRSRCMDHVDILQPIILAFYVESWESVHLFLNDAPCGGV